jgi:hypothetical protein
MGRLGREAFPDTEFSLILLDHTAELVPLSPNPRDPATLQRAINAISTDGSTDFSKSLKQALSILEERSPEKRKVVIFATDGQDSAYSRGIAPKLAEQIRKSNAGTFIVGVGADYDLNNLVALAGSFGFAGWAHTPASSGQNVFATLVPAFIKEIQSAEHYLEVHASGPDNSFFGLTPSNRQCNHGVFFIGYQMQGMGIYFTRSEEVNLELHVKSHQQDTAPVVTQIPIIPDDEAGAHFEKLEIARGAIAPLLVFLAQQARDTTALGALKNEYPTLAGPIDDFLKAAERAGFDADSRLDTNDSMSFTGTITGMSMLTALRGGGQIPVNQYSNVPGSPMRPSADNPALSSGTPTNDSSSPGDATIAVPKSPLNGDRRGGEAVNQYSVVDASQSPDWLSRPTHRPNVPADGSKDSLLHSGYIDGINVPPPDSIPPVDHPNAQAYQRIVPSNHPRLTIEGDSTYREIDLLEILADGDTAKIGRRNENQIVLFSPLVSRTHAELRREGDRYFIRDLESSNGTYRSGKPVTREIELQDGDVLTISSIRITARLPKRR